MQRWLLIGGAALLLLFGIGLPTAYHLYKQGRPHPVWLPIPVKPEAPYAETQRIVHSLDAKLSDRKNLIRITRELDLKSKWDMSDDEQVVDEILARLYVKQGDMDTPMGKIPAIHVGLRGTNRDREVSYALLDALLPDVWKVLGIDPPKKP
ncbi:MAG: hypothetical protein NTU84_10270 [Verrucomicrobia bacterium]|jgi:hypothetical protein|nr:hypothetical protein [Verrucomicrobiota bacterium]